ncbi:hypothetical protein AB1A81_02005 [Bdellovibrio bacteriovorus]|uniref:Uncharacterized protein n=1 Tax=Bdellovibrio bacteriovorus (strain ATCC 15356 / DSM 50701 / NCIMB 9529 / HD100) TaxID=264462 RepID=Q6MQN0_BDEBA|nr:hypothetical protein [Bdellovibrio bacteriovorus]CAE78417.1 hypothetical protein predicted by Glimmer/Critica [Bdellovibrio bacteriovorus HD100]
MKKKIVLAMAIIMVLGSVKAMAEEYEQDEIYREIQLGKIDATEAANGCEECALNTDGKLDAVEFDNLNQLTKTYAAEEDIKERQLISEVTVKISKIERLKDASQSQLNKEVQKTVTEAKKLRDMNKHNSRMLQKLSGDLDERWHSLNEMDERNQIQGLRVHPELRY